MSDDSDEILRFISEGAPNHSERKPGKHYRMPRDGSGELVGFIPCWKTVEGLPGNCRKPEGHEGACAPF